MNHNRVGLFFVLFCIWSSLAFADLEAPALSAKMNQPQIAPGGEATLEITVTMPKAVHIAKADDKDYPGVEIAFKLPEGFVADPSKITDLNEIPDGTKKNYVAKIRVGGEVAPGKYSMDVVAKVVYCDDSQCMSSELSASAELEIGGNAPVKALSDEFYREKIKSLEAQLFKMKGELNELTKSSQVAKPSAVHHETAESKPYGLLELVALSLAGIAFVVFLLAIKGKNMSGIAAAFLLIGFVLLATGISSGQHEKSKQIAETLCTACIGIEPKYTDSDFAEITVAQIDGLKRLKSPVVIYVFSAVWCKSCPVAKEDLKKLVAVNPEKLKLVVVDIEKQKSRLAGLKEWAVANKTGKPPLPTTVIAGDSVPLQGALDIASRTADRILEIKKK